MISAVGGIVLLAILCVPLYFAVVALDKASAWAIYKINFWAYDRVAKARRQEQQDMHDGLKEYENG